jgi:chromosome partitioning protein
VKLAAIEVEPVQGEPLASMATTKSSAGYLVLIDSAGVDHNSTRTALVKSDYVLIVSTTDPIDLWEVETVLKLVKELELKQQRAIPTVLVFNKVATQYNIKDVLNATEFLRANSIKPTFILKAVIKNRRAYKFAVGEGKGIAEYTPADNVARAEFTAMATELLTIVNPD